jgi:serine/threonine protein phosphatase 1
MGRTFVIGDIHGAYKALLQVLQRANFDYTSDHLIALGDVADGWPETKQCIDGLLQITNLTYLLGNHDFWTLEWMETGIIGEVWYEQGGKATVESYVEGIPDAHITFLKSASLYFELDGKVFVHAGIKPGLPLSQNSPQTLLWDRHLAASALRILHDNKTEKLTAFDEIYIGHTPISGGKPLKAAEVWLMDTGAGWSGVLSMMDIETKEIFSSDEVPSLYPGIAGRRKRS